MKLTFTRQVYLDRRSATETVAKTRGWPPHARHLFGQHWMGQALFVEMARRAVLTQFGDHDEN